MSLEIYIGPMFAGKTTKLMTMYNENSNPNKVVIDYDIGDKKYCNEVSFKPLLNHDYQKIDTTYKTQQLCNLKKEENYQLFSKDVSMYYYNMFINADDIYINECQFFPDLYHFVLEMLRYGKHIKLYGLDADFKQKKFGEVFDLIPYCTHLEKITGKCQHCENKSIVSHRTTANKEVYLPDANMYIPLCLDCRNDAEQIMST